MAKMTVPQWAKLIGISKPAAYKRIKSGKVSVDPDGMIDPEIAAAEWERNRDSVAQAKNPSGVAPVAEPVAPVPGAVSMDGSRADAQREREWIRVQNEKLELETRLKAVVRRDEVRTAVAAMITAAKSKMLAIGDELCDHLAADSDPVSIRLKINQKVSEALSHMAGWPNCAA